MRRSISILVNTLLALAFVPSWLSVSAQAAMPPGNLLRISTTFDGQAANGDSSGATLSADGRIMAFSSQASNLVPGDHNLSADIFLYDRQSSKLSLASLASDGSPANAASSEPALSADGHFVVFTSLANNLVKDDNNGLADVFIHDRLTGATERVSVADDSAQAKGWSHQPVVSGDGRYVAYSSTAGNLSPDDSNDASDIFVRDRRSGQTQRLSDGPGDSTSPALSSDGRYLAYLTGKGGSSRLVLYDLLTRQSSLLPLPPAPVQDEINLGRPTLSSDGQYLAFSAWSEHSSGIYLFDRSSGALKHISSSRGAPSSSPCLSISADGRYTAFEDRQGILINDQKAGQTQRVSLAVTMPKCPTLSASGRSLALIAATDQIANVFMADMGEVKNTTALLSGWVSDGLGHPMAGVNVSDGAGNSFTTKADGSFSFQEPFGHTYLLTPDKKGYSFSSTNRSISLTSDGIAGVTFVASPDAVLEEASKDIGMPYSLGRGCDSPLSECGGPFHGFYSGDCTDLVLDAYLEAVDFNIQLALDRDFRLNPRHYYRWRDARSAQDMWRFFNYSGLVLAPDEPYLPGDIVFFDWQSDGLIDHVAIISEVNSRGRPRKMIDASGKIVDNPSGLAAELLWKPFHSAQTPGHARWLGAMRKSAAAQNQPILVVALDSATVRLRLLDSASRAISSSGLEIPKGTFLSTGVGAVISVDAPLLNSEWYFIELSSSAQASYQLGVQAVQSGEVTSHRSFTRSIAAGETQLISVHLIVSGGKLTFELAGLQL